MRRILFVGFVSVSLAFNALSVQAGGHGGGGYHGGGYHGGGCYYGHGHGGCYGWWPLALGFGLGVAAAYPAYAYSYPAYSYPPVAYSYSQPVYVYQQPAVQAAPTTTAPAAPPTSSFVPASPSYAPAQAPANVAPAQVSNLAHSAVTAPVIQPQLVAVSPQPRGTWIQDPTPYRYTPEAKIASPNDTVAPSPSVTVTQSGSVPVYVVTR
jgi:hypothetical protein